MVDRLASGWDKLLLEWKPIVKMAVQIKETIQQQVETMDEAIDFMCESPVSHRIGGNRRR